MVGGTRARMELSECKNVRTNNGGRTAVHEAFGNEFDGEPQSVVRMRVMRNRRHTQRTLSGVLFSVISLFAVQTVGAAPIQVSTEQPDLTLTAHISDPRR